MINLVINLFLWFINGHFHLIPNFIGVFLVLFIDVGMKALKSTASRNLGAIYEQRYVSFNNIVLVPDLSSTALDVFKKLSSKLILASAAGAKKPVRILLQEL